MGDFAKGKRIILANGEAAVVKSKLGEGGQGKVYLVSVAGQDYALKWYHKKAISNPRRFYANLENNIRKGAPTSAFLWPEFLTKQTEGSFGYIMPLRPERYCDFSDFLLAKVRFKSISAVINAALNITNGFRDLHRSGFSYQDLNDGNFFIDPTNGDVLICDNDNVAPYGESLGIAGKARYMAPEVVRNIKRPDAMTDRFSLAVILFRLLFLDHPLEGRRTLCPCMTEEHELKFYGIDPVFIFDPTDESNRPMRGVHCNVMRFWQIYPQFVREKFTEAFSKASMHGKAARISDAEWQLTFTRLRDVLITCPCGTETFVDLTSTESTCIGCGLSIPRPPVLRVKKYAVALFPGKKLYSGQIDEYNDSYTEIAGEVVRNPGRPDVWGLRNLSRATWVITDNSGAQRTLQPGEAAAIGRIRQIQFIGCSGVID